jgi:hypothetical protein
MNKIEEIVKSWAISFNPTEEQQENAVNRLNICHSCEHMERGVFDKCGLCGCFLKGKVFSPREKACPDGRF